MWLDLKLVGRDSSWSIPVKEKRPVNLCVCGGRLREVWLRDVTGFVAKPSCYDKSDSPEVLGSNLRPVLNVSLKPTVYTRYDISSKPYAWWDVLALKLKKAKKTFGVWEIWADLGYILFSCCYFRLRIYIYILCNSRTLVFLSLHWNSILFCQCIFSRSLSIIDG